MRPGSRSTTTSAWPAPSRTTTRRTWPRRSSSGWWSGSRSSDTTPSAGAFGGTSGVSRDISFNTRTKPTTAWSAAEGGACWTSTARV